MVKPNCRFDPVKAMKIYIGYAKKYKMIERSAKELGFPFDGCREYIEKHPFKMELCSNQEPSFKKPGCQNQGVFLCSRCNETLFCSLKCQKNCWDAHKLCCQSKKMVRK